MKWFKHQTDSLDDPFIQELICNFGGNGYLVYFGIIEMICKESKTQLSGKATLPGRFVKQKLHISKGKVEEILRFCQGKGKLFFNFSEENFNFDFPKILEIKDNYTRDCQVTAKNVSNHKDTYNKDTDTEKDKTLSADSEKTKSTEPVKFDTKISFENVWETYPRKLGKKKAFRHYQATVKNIGDHLDLIKAMANYIQYADAMGYDYQHGATWFNNWQDHIKPHEIKARASLKTSTFENKRNVLKDFMNDKSPIGDQTNALIEG